MIDSDALDADEVVERMPPRVDAGAEIARASSLDPEVAAALNEIAKELSTVVAYMPTRPDPCL